ncbi:FAD-binding oxidoreductase [Moraxella sp.]|uniref:FAD-binding oxidoreductase n=1 Tax=Moraxella sp. TaxID=479 RepID=UPI0026DCB5E0|nr:FAD-linked oxidase C-terminal domain-containing protein [Moraxella sp.]MDO4894659.1 FAD-linked oxidase C-terminal domain-containing protein [Moraxella sp.]
MNERFSEAITKLSQTFGKALSTNLTVRQQHAHTMSWIETEAPDAVLTVTNKQQISEAVKICNAHKMPVIAFGTGSSLEGQLNAPHGGLCIDMSQMTNIVRIDAEDLTATVEAGVTREQLNEALRHTGLFFPIDPGANASIGGMCATRASGTNAVKYGTMKDVVLCLEVVLPNGDIIKTGTRAKKSSAGYDLTRLMIGSEGTLGIITEITVKLFGQPDCVGSGLCHFNDIDGACQAVMLTIQYGLPVARLELLDGTQIKACNAYSKLNLQETPTLFVEFHGTANGVAEQAQIFAGIIEEFGGFGFTYSQDESERKKLWTARHNAYYAAKALKPDFESLSTDACVPISRLAECVGQTVADIKEQGMTAPVVGHVGDGNFHVLLLLDKNNPDDIQKTKDILSRLAKRAIAMDGTCTGEHGVGQGKRAYMALEHGDEAIAVMKAIKSAIDPNHIMNPDKIWFE